MVEPTKTTGNVKAGSELRASSDKSPQMDFRALSKASSLREASSQLRLVSERGIHMKVEDYVFLLQGCVAMKDLDVGKQVHSLIVQIEPELTLVLSNALVNMYCKCGSVVDAHNLFYTMNKKDVFTWTTIIAGYAILGPPESALTLFWDMEAEKVIPDEVTFLSIIKACAKLKVLEHGKRIHARMKQNGIKENVVLRSSLVDMYAKCGSIECARQEFKEMPSRDIVSWNAMISGYAQNGFFKDVLNLFLQMMREGSKPDRITLANVLKACASLKMLNYGMCAHDFVIKQQLDADTFVGSTLVDMYAKCGSISDAWKVFHLMPRRTEVSWNAMISGYAQPGCAEKSLNLFWKMELEKMTRTVVTYVGALKACAVLGVLEQGKLIHESFMKSGIKANLILRNALVDMYSKCGDVKEARRTFDEMPERDIVSWNALIAGYAADGPAAEAIELYQKMQREAIQPCRVTFLSVLKACISLPSLEQGKKIHLHIRRRGLETDIFVASTLVDMYAKCGSVEEAQDLFDGMQERNEVAWNAMIAGYVQHGHLDQAFKLFKQMEESSIKPVKVTYLSILKACGSLGDIEKGKHTHTLIAMNGYDADNFIKNSLVDMYAKCADVDNAQHLFDELDEKNLISWNALISGYVQQEQIETAFELFGEMEQANIEPNEVTFMTAMRACASPAYLDHGRRIHSFTVQGGFESFLYVGNSLIDMYARCRSLEDARHVFDFMPKGDLVTWNAMIAGYSSVGIDEEAFKLFRQMSSQGLQPDEVTFLSLLKASAGLGSLKHGKEVHALIKKNGLQSNTVGNAVIDMYAKCGSCDDAHNAFKNLPQREVVSWNIVISGYLQHGRSKEALELFHEMKQEHLDPDRVTILSVLKACGTLGYLDQAKQIHVLAENFGVEFDLFLRNTLIDMYGKCGDVKAATQIFDEMEERDSVSWNALMTGYAQNGRVSKTLDCLHRMHVAEQKVDHVTYVTALSVCNHAGLVEEGCYHFYSLHSIHGISHTQEHCACMVDTLCRAGRVVEAAEFINKMPFHPGAAVWMALLGSCRIVGINISLAMKAAKSIFELQPHNTAPYVLLSNTFAVLEDWEGIDQVGKVSKGKAAVTPHAHMDDTSECKYEMIHSELHRLFSKLKLAS